MSPPDGPAPPAVPELPDLSEPRRLSPLTPVVRGPLLLAALVGVAGRDLFTGGDLPVFAALLGGALLLGGVFGLLTWRFTRFWVAADELRIESGVVVRRSRRIRIDRLQGIDVSQPFLARLLGLAQLEFDVAGGDREGALAFLRVGEAEEVRQALLARRDRQNPELADGPRQAPQTDVLWQLDAGRLLVGLALTPEAILLGLSALALLAFGLAAQSLAAMGGFVPVVLGLGWALGRRLVGYYGFTVTHRVDQAGDDTTVDTTLDTTLGITRGLLSVSAQTIRLERVQGVVVTEPVLWRPLGWARVEVSLAGYESNDRDAVKASPMLMPVATRREADALVRRVLRGLEPERVPLAAPPGRARWRAPLSWRLQRFGQDDHLLVSRRGWLNRRTDAVPKARAQSLHLRQGPWRRMLRLADVHVDSPPGPVSVVGPLRDAHEAWRHVEAALVRRL